LSGSFKSLANAPEKNHGHMLKKCVLFVYLHIYLLELWFTLCRIFIGAKHFIINFKLRSMHMLQLESSGSDVIDRLGRYGDSCSSGMSLAGDLAIWRLIPVRSGITSNGPCIQWPNVERGHVIWRGGDDQQISW